MAMGKDMPSAMPPVPPMAKDMPSAASPMPAAPMEEKGLAGGVGGAALGGMAGGPLGALAGAGLGSVAQDQNVLGGLAGGKAMEQKAVDLPTPGQLRAPDPQHPMSKAKETENMTDVELAKSVSEIAAVMKAMAPAMKALSDSQASLRAELANIRKELPVKDGAKYAKDEEHDATTTEQETQVHEAAPEAAVKTFKPENKTEGAFAPKMKAVPEAAPKTVNLEALVNKAVEARLAKAMPAVSATPAPPVPSGTASGEAPWKYVMKSVVDNDRKLHGVYPKNTEGIDTGYRSGDESIKVQSAMFFSKMRRDLGA